MTRDTSKGSVDVPPYRYTAVFEPAAEAAGYIVSVPALPGLVTEGDTIEEARAMVKDAIRGYIESLVKHGEDTFMSGRLGCPCFDTLHVGSAGLGRNGGI